MEHELKILPEYFKAVREGTKTFEIRKNDRGFDVGDTLILKEYEKHLFYSSNMIGEEGYWRYTGQEIAKEISYILEGGQYGLEEGYCILGLKAPFKDDILNQLIEEFGMDAKMIKETYERYIWSINYYYKHSMKLKNIDLSGITLVDELEKRDEEYKEFADALLTYLFDTNEITKEHLKEEACDVIQVVLSVLKILEIEVEEITEYWNTKHLEKLKNRPRKDDKNGL